MKLTIYRFCLLVILPIAVGSLIYVGWRTTSLWVFHWLAFCGIPSNVFRPSAGLPSVVLYSLPDGCWVIAGTSWMLMIWKRLHPWVFTFVALAIGGEFGQAAGIVPGTFEWNDVSFYTFGFILALIGYRYAETPMVDNSLTHHDRPRCG
ncbi:MAG: hypothetical protein ACK57V_05675 [Pirellula sp.]|jgi:hypothetical protein